MEEICDDGLVRRSEGSDAREVGLPAIALADVASIGLVNVADFGGMNHEPWVSPALM